MVLLGSMVGGEYRAVWFGENFEIQGGGSLCCYRLVIVFSFYFISDPLCKILVLGWLVRMITCMADLLMLIRNG